MARMGSFLWLLLTNPLPLGSSEEVWEMVRVYRRFCQRPHENLRADGTSLHGTANKVRRLNKLGTPKSVSRLWPLSFGGFPVSRPERIEPDRTSSNMQETEAFSQATSGLPNFRIPFGRNHTETWENPFAVAHLRLLKNIPTNTDLAQIPVGICRTVSRGRVS